MSRKSSAVGQSTGDDRPAVHTTASGCICSPTQRDWHVDGICRICTRSVTERQLQEEIRLALGSIPGLVLWRNNVGEAMVDYGRGNIRPLVYGLAPGSADLIGCYRGRFVALEIKTPSGKQSKEQQRFQRCVERNGGVYLMPRSVTQAVELVESIGVAVAAGPT